MTSYTTNLRLPIPDFLTEPWEEEFAASMRAIDTAIANALLAINVSVWANSTAYTIGDIVTSPDNPYEGPLWICAVAHTSSASPVTFSDYRTSNPTHWIVSATIPQQRGTWTTATAYVVGDFVIDTGRYAVCLIAHTSGTFNTDLAAGKWSVLIDTTTIRRKYASVRASAILNNIVIATGLENGDAFGSLTLATGDRIALFAQTAPAENGVYVVQASGAAVRADDFSTYDDHVGALIYAEDGTNAETIYKGTSNAGGILGTTAIVFANLRDDNVRYDTATSLTETQKSQARGNTGTAWPTVRLAATANVVIASALEAGDTIDGVTLVVGDRVLLPVQTDPIQNGVYIVVAAAAGIASRAPDFATYDSHIGIYISVTEGTANAESLWKCYSNIGGILGTTGIGYAKTGIYTQTFTASGTYTPVAGMSQAIIECWGGGGAGGSADGNATLSGGGGGGGAGGYSRMLVTAISVGASKAVTIGAAGAVAAAGNNAGGSGGTTSVGVLCTATGGTGGGGSAGAQGNGGAGGAAGAGLIASAGEYGYMSTGNASGATTNVTAGGRGGSTSIGSGGESTAQYGATGAGNSGTGYGAGGSGASCSASASDAAGGAGRSGFVIITEYVF